MKSHRAVSNAYHLRDLEPFNVDVQIDPALAEKVKARFARVTQGAFQS